MKGLLKKLFGVEPTPVTVEHAVVVHFDYGSTDFEPIFALEQDLARVLEAVDAGEFDGNEIAVDGSDAYFYMYGRDADRMLEVIRPTLEAASFMRGARVSLRYGSIKDKAPERTIVLPT